MSDKWVLLKARVVEECAGSTVVVVDNGFGDPVLCVGTDKLIDIRRLEGAGSHPDGECEGMKGRGLFVGVVDSRRGI